MSWVLLCCGKTGALPHTVTTRGQKSIAVQTQLLVLLQETVVTLLMQDRSASGSASGSAASAKSSNCITDSSHDYSNDVEPHDEQQFAQGTSHSVQDGADHFLGDAKRYHYEEEEEDEDDEDDEDEDDDACQLLHKATSRFFVRPFP